MTVRADEVRWRDEERRQRDQRLRRRSKGLSDFDQSKIVSAEEADAFEGVWWALFAHVMFCVALGIPFFLYWLTGGRL